VGGRGFGGVSVTRLGGNSRLGFDCGLLPDFLARVAVEAIKFEAEDFVRRAVHAAVAAGAAAALRLPAAGWIIALRLAAARRSAAGSAESTAGTAAWLLLILGDGRRHEDLVAPND